MAKSSAPSLLRPGRCPGPYAPTVEPVISSLGPTPGLTVAGSSLVADGTAVGGDWADVLPSPRGGGARLVIGDAMGSGSAALGLQTMLRGAARHWLGTNVDVRPAMESLDGLVAAREETIATLLVAGVDPETGLASVVNAGHPPPLFVDHTGRAAFLRAATNPPLGVGTPDAVPVHTTMTPGSTLVLYTDGLVERRTLPLAAGFARLRAAAAGCHTVPVERLAKWLLAASLTAGPAEDDATVVVARVIR